MQSRILFCSTLMLVYALQNLLLVDYAEALIPRRRSSWGQTGSNIGADRGTDTQWLYSSGPRRTEVWNDGEATDSAKLKRISYINYKRASGSRTLRVV